jgi:hypothetical protein
MSASWYLFILMLLAPKDGADLLFIAWIISLFITFH